MSAGVLPQIPVGQFTALPRSVRGYLATGEGGQKEGKRTGRRCRWEERGKVEGREATIGGKGEEIGEGGNTVMTPRRHVVVGYNICIRPTYCCTRALTYLLTYLHSWLEAYKTGNNLRNG